MVAGQAVEKTAVALRDVLIDFAARNFGCKPEDCSLQDDSIICANRKIPLTEIHAAGAKIGDRFVVRRKAYLSPRTIGFNVQGVRLAVHRVTGEVMTLQSVHAADIGKADQSDAVPRPARRRRRHGLRLGALREDGL